MKKILSAGLIFILCICFVGCTGGERDSLEQYLLPHGLNFGDSYETCVEKYPYMPEFEPADANAGYFGSGDYVNDNFLQDFFGVSDDVDTNAIMLSYSFNQDEKLYEFYVTTTLQRERDAENAFNGMADYYSEKLETEAEFSESAEALEANLKTERFGVTVSLSPMDEEGFMLYLVVHDFANDLEQAVKG